MRLHLRFGMTRRLLCVACLFLIGCERTRDSQSQVAVPAERTTSPSSEKLSLRLKWFVYSSFAHHFIAQEDGLFAREGVEVDIRPGGVGIDPIRSVSAGEDDLGLASYAQILLAREKGVPVVAIAEEYVKSGVVFLALRESGITKPDQFVGKRVGWIPGSDTGTVYVAVMAKLGIDRRTLTEVTIGFDLTPLLTGAIDVSTVGYISNQPIAVEHSGHPVSIIDPYEYGVRPGGNVVFTTETTLKNRRQALGGFVRAMLSAIIASQSMPDERVVDIVLDANPKLKRETEIKVWRVTKEYLLSNDPKRVGSMPRRTWKHTAEIFRASGLLKHAPDISACYTDELVESARRELAGR